MAVPKLDKKIIKKRVKKFKRRQSDWKIYVKLHAEAGNGRFEIALHHTDCSKAADNLIYAREVIRAVARKHGLLATFLPKYALDDIGSGSHVHVSLSKNGENVFAAHDGSSRHGMSEIGEELVAGVPHHLPSLLAFTTPIPNSYERIQPNTWSGAYLCWGKENREAPVRTACPPGVPDGIVSNFEIKAFDGCANPHLALAAVIASGIDGLRRHLPLSDHVDENPAVRQTPKTASLPCRIGRSSCERHNFRGFVRTKTHPCYKRGSHGWRRVGGLLRCGHGCRS